MLASVGAGRHNYFRDTLGLIGNSAPMLELRDIGWR
jgi:hypothetical protein